jgi:hypothetical protein
MTDANELLEAAKALLPYLKASTDQRKRLDYTIATKEEILADMESDREKYGWHLPRAEQLRREAVQIEAKDAAIERFRAAIAAL